MPACWKLWILISSLVPDVMSVSANRLVADVICSDTMANERETTSRRSRNRPTFKGLMMTMLITASSAVMGAEAVAWVVMLLVPTASVVAVLSVRATARVSPLFAPICKVMDEVDPLGKVLNELARRSVCHNTTDPDVRILVTTG